MMTETTTTTAPAVRQRIVGGVLSDIQRSSENGVTAVTATLTTTFQGRVTVRRLTVADDVLATVDPLLVEGPVVKFYATVSETDVTVLGPDLTQRPVASTQAPAAKPTKPKRPQTEAQKKAWAEVILPKLQVGRARAAAARQAEKAAKAVAAGEMKQAA